MFDGSLPEVADLPALDDTALVDAVSGWLRAENAACARKLAVLAELFTRRTGIVDDEREWWWVDPCAALGAELAAALGSTSGLALTQTHRGVALHDRLPKVAALFEAGLISDLLVRAIVSRTGLITDRDVMAAVDADLADQVRAWGALPVKKTERAIDALVEKHDAGALRRKETTAPTRTVEFGSPTDKTGFTSLWARLYSTDGAALEQQLGAMARSVCADDPRTIDERRADALGALAAGRDLECECGAEDCAAKDRRPTVPNAFVHVVADAASVAAAMSAPENSADSGEPGHAERLGDTEDAGDSGHSGGSEDTGHSGDSDSTGDSGRSGDSERTGDSGRSGDSERFGDAGDADDTEDAGDSGHSSDSEDSSHPSDAGDFGDSGDSADAHAGHHPAPDPGPASPAPPPPTPPPPASQERAASPAFVMGGGILPASLLPAVLKRARVREIRHPGDAPPEDGYRPSAALAEFVRCRDLTCRFPDCDVPADRCDIDHTIPWPLGPTHAANLKCMCRANHLLKTFWGGEGGWRDVQQPDGTVTWTSPTGHTYVTRPGSALLFPTLCIPTGGLVLPGDDAAPKPNAAGGRSAMMPKRRRTRAQDRARRIAAERRLNDASVAERNKPPPF